MQESKEGVVRLFVAGFPSTNAQQQLGNKLSQFGELKSFEIVTSPQDAVLPREFAYVDFVPKSSASLDQCIRLLHKTKWFGKEVRIERAKMHYLKRLQREWDDLEQQTRLENTVKDTKNTPESEFNVSDMWKKGKGGRLVALLNIHKKYGRGVFSYDPTKWQRNIKVFDEDGNIVRPAKKQRTATVSTMPNDDASLVESKYDTIHKEELQRETTKSLDILESILQTSRPPLLPEDNVDN